MKDYYKDLFRYIPERICDLAEYHVSEGEEKINGFPLDDLLNKGVDYIVDECFNDSVNECYG